MKQRVFAAGDTITTEGEHGVGFFVIEDGEAAVTVAASSGRSCGAATTSARSR